MAAAAFKGTVTFVAGDGKTQTEAFTASDVADALVTFTSTNNNFINIRGRGRISLVDISLSAAGTDTSQINLFASGLDTGERILNAGIVATVNNRMPAPKYFLAGSSFQIKQLA